MMLKFEWDNNKADINLKKHGVSFEDAKTVFYDENGIIFDDIDNSSDENRFLLLGIGKNLKLLIVCHCYREGDTIRIISARKATKGEAKIYEKYGIGGN